MENNPSDQLKMEIMLNANLMKVWRAWTYPDQILQWFGSDPEGKGLDAELDVRPGGSYEIHFIKSKAAVKPINQDIILPG